MNDIEAKKKKEIHLTELELLAPAKNLECGIAAIDHGAVYRCTTFWSPRCCCQLA